MLAKSAAKPISKKKRPADAVQEPGAAKKKRVEPEPAPEPEPEPEPEEEEPEPEGEEVTAAKKKALARRKRKAKLVGYRTLARQAGFVDHSVAGRVSDGGDAIRSLISISEAKRLMRFVPATPGAIGFSADEFKKRLELFKSSVPASAARETQARCDVVLRAVMNQVVARTVEAGKKTVSASAVAAVLRPYASKLDLTAVAPPRGLVRYAQDEGILDSREADVDERKDDKKQATANKKLFTEFAEAEQRRVEAVRAKRAQKAQQMAELGKAAEKEVKGG